MTTPGVFTHINLLLSSSSDPTPGPIPPADGGQEGVSVKQEMGRGGGTRQAVSHDDQRPGKRLPIHHEHPLYLPLPVRSDLGSGREPTSAGVACRLCSGEVIAVITQREMGGAAGWRER